MSTLFNKEVRDALFHGLVAGVLVLVLNGIGHYVFEAPAIPFAWGLAAVLVVIVTAVQLFVHPHDGSHNGV
jgi:hypothetical protein